MAKLKINLLKFLDDDINDNIKRNNLEFEDAQKTDSVRSLLERTLKNHQPSQKDIGFKVKSIISIFNTSNNIEVIRKSSKGIEFSELLSSGKDGRIFNIAFIARFKDNIDATDGQYNGIIITTDYVQKQKSEGVYSYFKLININLVNIQENNYNHPKVKVFDGITINADIKSAYDRRLLLTAQDLTPLMDLKKSLDVWSDNPETQDSLKLNNFMIITNELWNMLKNKRDDVIRPYWVDPTSKVWSELDNLKQQNSNGHLTIENELIFKLWVIENKNKSFKSKKKYIISDERDESQKMNVFVKDEKEISFVDQVNYEAQKIEKRIEILLSQSNKDSEELKNLKSKLEAINNAKQQNDQHLEARKGIANYISSNLEQLKLQKEKLKKQKNKSDKIKALTIEINQAENEKSDLDKVINELKEQELILDKNLSNTSTKYDNLTIVLNQTKLTLEKENSRKDILLKNINRLKEENKTIYELTLSGFYKEDTRSNIKRYTETFDVPFTSMFDFLVGDFTTRIILSDYDQGFAQKIKRQFYTFNEYVNGSFKSPYAAISLDNPNVEIKVHNIRSNMKFNKLQQKALNASVGAHFASFIQGPPGTGKTQIIASSIDNSISVGENVIITSSTHEAINNAFERASNNWDNPNQFFLRYATDSAKTAKVIEYTDQNMYKNFLRRIFNYIKRNNKSGNYDFSPIRDLLDDEIAIKYIPRNYQNLLDKHSYDEYLREVAKTYNIEYEDGFEEDDIPSEIKKLYRRLTRNIANNQKIEKIETFLSANNLLENFPLEKGLRNYIKYLDDENDNEDQKSFFTLISNIERNYQETFSEKVPEEYIARSKQFVKFLFDNELINIIGVTSSSNLKINVFNGKDKDLFTGYRINNAIIDEVSKSITPEILNISKLTEKIMMVGDYRQLPPVTDMEEKLLTEFREHIINNSHVNEKLKKWASLNQKGFNAKVTELYSNPLFAQLVYKMKDNAQNKQISYVALREQYRFGNAINELVNITYEDDEKLTVGKETEFRYKLGNKKTTSRNLSLINTTKITKDIAKELSIKGYKVKEGDYAFDQNHSIIANLIEHSKINDYNALVVVKILNNLIDKNNKNFDINKVGVIAMTRSQAYLIKQIIKNREMKHLYSIKIDTVDNFQGREKNIIILDLVRAPGKLHPEIKKAVYEKTRNLDFYSKPERLNVAASRAKHKLIIVGAVRGYLDEKVNSEVRVDGKYEEMKLFTKWLKVISEYGEVREWEEF